MGILLKYINMQIEIEVPLILWMFLMAVPISQLSAKCFLRYEQKAGDSGNN